MKIPLVPFIIALLVLMAPFFILWSSHRSVGVRAAKALGRVLCVMIVYAAVLGVMAKVGSAFLDIIFVVLMIAVASFMVCRRSCQPLREALLPVFTGLFAVVAFVVVCLVLFVVGFGEGQSFLHCLVPMTGLLAFSAIRSNARALATFHAETLRRDRLYEFLVGNGAKRSEALHYYVSRSVLVAATSCVSSMAMIGLSSAPVAMWTVMLCGGSVLTAVEFQVLLCASTLSVSLVSMFITLVVACQIKGK